MSNGFRSKIAQVVAGVAAVALVFGLGGCSLGTPSLDEASNDKTQQTIDDSVLVQPGTLTVALDTSDAPQAITASDGTLQGYEVDVASALAEHMGLKAALVSASSPSSALGDKKADIYLGATSTDESDDISVEGELFQNATAIFGTSSGDAPSSTITASDLANARVGVQEGSASQEALAGVGVTASTTYNNVNECFEALASGEVDYVACDATAGGYLARSYDGMFFAGVISSSTSYGIAYRSDATGLLEDVSSTFDSLAADGTLDAIHQIWYGPVPLNLSSELVSGVTLPADDKDDSNSSDDANSSDGASSSDNAGSSDGMPKITEDINSLD